MKIINTPYLVIVESPSKCKKIETYLGFEYKCISSKGHIRSLSKVSNFEPEFDVMEIRKRHVEEMRAVIALFAPQNIFLATDDDREGESIAWHICQVFGLPETTHRVIFHEITKPAICRAIQNPIRLRMNMVYAQQARQIVDRLIGYTISPLLTKLLVHDGKFLSAGRCQTPTLRLLFDHEQTPELDLHYAVHGSFFTHPSTLSLRLKKTFATSAECVRFLEDSKAFAHILTVEDQVLRKTAPPLPFNTSRLLQAVNMSAEQCMNLCQTLYQNGHITYLRTDSKQYSESFLQTVRQWFDKKGYVAGDWKDLQSQEDHPHEAIRVTQIDVSQLVGDDERLNALYHFIWRRTVESCMAAYEYGEIPLRISAPISWYDTSLQWPMSMGWKTLGAKEKVADVFYYRRWNGKKIAFHFLEGKMERVHRPHYTEGTLIQKMDELGIGRPSTYASLVGTLLERKYVLKEDIPGTLIRSEEHTLTKDIHSVTKERWFGKETNKLVLQDLGRQAIRHLVEHFSTLFSYDYTKKMEDELDEIVPDTWKDICKSCDEELKKCVKPLKAKMKLAYDIDDEYQLVFCKTGAVLQHKETKEYVAIHSDRGIDFSALPRSAAEWMAAPIDALGEYEGSPLFVRKGLYGYYAEWGERRESLKSYKGEHVFDQVVAHICAKKDQGVLRTLAHDVFIKKGKYGSYVQQGKSCTSLKKFKGDYLTCPKEDLFQWLQSKIV